MAPLIRLVVVANRPHFKTEKESLYGGNPKEFRSSRRELISGFRGIGWLSWTRSKNLQQILATIFTGRGEFSQDLRPGRLKH